jgi:hypothetical protein
VIARIGQQLPDGDRTSVRAKNCNIHRGIVPTVVAVLSKPVSVLTGIRKPFFLDTGPVGVLTFGPCLDLRVV